MSTNVDLSISYTFKLSNEEKHIEDRKERELEERFTARGDERAKGVTCGTSRNFLEVGCIFNILV